MKKFKIPSLEEFAKINPPTDKIFPYQQQILDSLEKPKQTISLTRTEKQEISKVGLRPDLVIIDDLLCSREQSIHRRILQEKYSIVVYSYMLDTMLMAVSKTHKNDRNISIVNHIREFHIKIMRTYGIDFTVVFLPMGEYKDVSEYLHKQCQINIHPNRVPSGDIYIEGLRYKFYTSKMDMTTTMEKLYIADNDIRFGVVEYE